MVHSLPVFDRPDMRLLPHNVWFSLCLIGITLSGTAEVRRSVRNPQRLTAPPALRRADGNGPTASAAEAVTQTAASRNRVTRVAFLGPKNGWGFTKRETSYYSPAGKRLGTVPGGTLFRYSDVKASSKNPMLLSRLRRDHAWDEPCLLDCTETATYEGDPETVDPAIVGNLHAFFLLTGRIAAHKATLAEKTHAANPHFLAARAAQRAYQASLAQADRLEAEAQTCTGARKVKILDALRALKYEQVRLQSEVSRTATAFTEWNQTHPATAPAEDPALRKLEREREAVRAKVADLIPPDVS